ncbi:UNVERIFIED_CONTAM: hypothetical protein Sradi_2421800 [Sesamum radiatum]|uniref:Ubiquitin-like domain-containing protein n=1 Tax=Sesamum radiatum TaxID=300843 RepID=A0AAW2SHN9_SESRA
MRGGGGRKCFLKMKLVAEILTGSLFFVEVEDNATVGDLKKKIGEQEHLPTRRLILILDADERLLLNGNDNKQDQTEPSDETDDSTPSESDQNEPSDEEDDESTPSADSSSDQQED